MTNYTKSGGGQVPYAVGTTTYDESGVEETYEPGETIVKQDFKQVSEELNEIYGDVRVGGGMDSPQEDLINEYHDAVTGLTDSELREVIRPYSENGLNNDNWEQVTGEMIVIAQDIKTEKHTDSYANTREEWDMALD